MSEPNLSSLMWSTADLLRSDYKQSDCGKVILPLTVLRRLDCVLQKTKPAVLAELEVIVGLPTDMFYNRGIATYVWVVSNRKPPSCKGKVRRIGAGEEVTRDAAEPKVVTDRIVQMIQGLSQ